jgi:hypothetical protein
MTGIVLCYAEEQNLYPPKVDFTSQERGACWAAPGLITCWRSYIERASDTDMAYTANHEVGHLAGCWGEEPPLSCMLPVDERCL